MTRRKSGRAGGPSTSQMPPAVAPALPGTGAAHIAEVSLPQIRPVLDALFVKACDLMAGDSSIGPGLALTCLLCIALLKRDNRVAWAKVKQCWTNPRDEFDSLLRDPALADLADAFRACLKKRNWLDAQGKPNDPAAEGLKSYLEGRRGDIMRAEQFGNSPGRRDEVCAVLVRARDQLRESGTVGGLEEFSEIRLKRVTTAAGIHYELATSGRASRHTANIRTARRSPARGVGPIEFTRGSDRDHFTRLLVQAKRLTFVGVLHQNLIDLLVEARKKRDRTWEQVRVVFMNQGLLDLVHDQHVKPDRVGMDPRLGVLMPDLDKIKERHEIAVRKRKEIMTRARGRLERFLENHMQPDGWAFFDYGYFPVFTGTLLEGGDVDLLQFAVLHPDGDVENRIYIHVQKPRGGRGKSRNEEQAEIYEYYRQIFEKVVVASKPYVPQFLAGNVHSPEGFGAWTPVSRADLQPRNKILFENQLLATSLIVLVRSGRVLLQWRTPDNSTLEHGVYSSVWAYVQPGDLGLKPDKSKVDDTAFEQTIRRKMLEKFGEQPPEAHDLTPMARIACDRTNPLPRYYHIYAAQFDGEIPGEADISEWTFDELALLHLYQGLSDAAAGGASHLAMLRHELILHKKMPPEDDAELRRMCARWCDEAWDILTSAHLEPVDRPIHRDSDVKPRLLIGPEYTHFWTHFVPIYQKLAVQGVAEFLESIRASPDARFALEALQTGHRPATPPSAASSPPVGDSQH